MNYIGYSPWQDAARFGEGVGNALSQGLLQLPQERYGLALQQAQLARALEQMRMNQEYHQGMLGNRLLDIQMRGQNAQDLNSIRQQLADLAGQKAAQGRVEGGFFVPGVGGQGLPGATNQQPSMVPQQSGQTNQQQLPSGIVPLQRPMTPFQSNQVQNAQQGLDLRKLLAQAALMSATNSPAIQGLTNRLNQIGQPLTPPVQGFQTNSINDPLNLYSR